jgi:hypothetical protein
MDCLFRRTSSFPDGRLQYRERRAAVWRSHFYTYLSIIFLSLHSSSAAAFGALTVGREPQSRQYVGTLSLNAPTQDQANSYALRDCISKGLVECKVIQHFSKTCVGLALTPLRDDGSSVTNDDHETSKERSLAECRRHTNNNNCFIVISGCDTLTASNSSPIIVPTQYTPPSTGASLGPLFDTLGFFLIIGIIIGVIFKFMPAKPKVPQIPKPVVPPVQPLEPLAPGSLMRATIEPLSNNTIRLLIQLSDEAREILDKQNIWQRVLFDKSNPLYDAQMRAYTDAWARYESDKKSTVETIRWFAKPPIDAEPSKIIYTTVSEFCSAEGFVRAFPTAGEAKAWATELRTHIENLKNIIEQNKAPPVKETFDF